jgi:hypothetical protein
MQNSRPAGLELSTDADLKQVGERRCHYGAGRIALEVLAQFPTDRFSTWGERFREITAQGDRCRIE